MTRVHIVQEPLSDYLRFELGVVYPTGVEAGEDIRILATDSPNAQGPDFWLLDDTVCLMDYDDAGDWLGADLITEPAALTRARAPSARIRPSTRVRSRHSLNGEETVAPSGP